MQALAAAPKAVFRLSRLPVLAAASSLASLSSAGFSDSSADAAPNALEARTLRGDSEIQSSTGRPGQAERSASPAFSRSARSMASTGTIADAGSTGPMAKAMSGQSVTAQSKCFSAKARDSSSRTRSVKFPCRPMARALCSMRSGD